MFEQELEEGRVLKLNAGIVVVEHGLPEFGCIEKNVAPFLADMAKVKPLSSRGWLVGQTEYA